MSTGILAPAINSSLAQPGYLSDARHEAASAAHSHSGQLRFARRAATFVMLIVVMDHSILPLPVGANSISVVDHLLRQVAEFVKLFNMPVFFFLAGLVFAHTSRDVSSVETIPLLAEKARRLLIPYLVISSLAFPIKCYLSKYALRPVHFSLSCYWETLIYPWANTIVFYWFLPTLFCMFLFAPMMLSMSRRSSLLVKCSFTVLLACIFAEYTAGSRDLVVPANWTGVLHYLLFFWGGIMLYPQMVAAGELLRPHVAVLVGLATLGAALLLFNAAVQVGPSWTLVMNLVGIATMFSFAIGMPTATHSVFDYLGKNSYQVYLFSWFFHQFVIMLSKRFPAIPIEASEAASFACGLMGPILLAELLRKLPMRWIRPVVGL